MASTQSLSNPEHLNQPTDRVGKPGSTLLNRLKELKSQSLKPLPNDFSPQLDNNMQIPIPNFANSLPEKPITETNIQPTIFPHPKPLEKPTEPVAAETNTLGVAYLDTNLLNQPDLSKNDIKPFKILRKPSEEQEQVKSEAVKVEPKTFAKEAQTQVIEEPERNNIVNFLRRGVEANKASEAEAKFLNALTH